MCIGVIVALEDIALLPLRGGNDGNENPAGAMSFFALNAVKPLILSSFYNIIFKGIS